MPIIKSIQTGNWSDLGTSDSYKEITISAVTIANAVVTYTIRTESESRPNKDSWTCFLKDTTTIRFERDETGYTDDEYVEWEVTEFESGEISVQSGAQACTADPTDITISAITSGKAVPILFFKTDLLADTQKEFMPEPSFTSTTNLRLDFQATPGTDDYYLTWQVVEFNSADVSIQTGSASWNNNQSPKDVTISSVTINNCWVLGFNATSDVGVSTKFGKNLSRNYLSDSTSLYLENIITSPSIITLYCTWFVVEFLDGTTVQNGTSNITDTNTTLNITLTTIDQSNTSIMNHYRFMNFSSDATAGDSAQESLHTKKLTSTTNMQYERFTGNGDVSVAWFAIEWALEVATIHRRGIMDGVARGVGR